MYEHRPVPGVQLPFGFTLTRDDLNACWRLTHTRTGSEVMLFCGRPFYEHRDVLIGFAYWRDGHDGDPFRRADRWANVTLDWRLFRLVWMEDVDATTGWTGREWRLYRWRWQLPEFRYG